jgi:sugar phosphate isomerase/epimerase
LKYRLHRQLTLDATSLPALRDTFSTLREAGLGLDLMLSDTAFNREVPFRELENLRRDLADEGGLPISCHLPYIDLHLGSRDSKVAEFSRDSLSEGLEIASVLRAQIAVVHVGFSNHIPPRRVDGWRDLFVERITELASTAEAEDIVLALENTYESDASVLSSILETVNSPFLRFCPDLGHAACFSRMAPEEWIDQFKTRIVIMHFHDNDGLDDLHQTCGEGVVDYEPVFQACKVADLSCPIVLEVPEDAWDPSIDHLKRIGFEFGEVPAPSI